MASHAPTTGAPTRAPAFPDLQPLESATAVLRTWDEALRRYELLNLLGDACCAFGPGRWTDQEVQRSTANAVAAHGSLAAARRDPEWAAQLDKTWRANADVEKRESRDYFVPADAAAVELVSIPAPTFDALRAKVAVINQRELWNHRGVEGDCFAIVEADARRLLGERA